jgi:hypothetical protein
VTSRLDPRQKLTQLLDDLAPIMAGDGGVHDELVSWDELAVDLRLAADELLAKQDPGWARGDYFGLTVRPTTAAY